MKEVFAYVIGLGASVMMPVIFTVLGVCIGIKLSKALKSGLLVGVGFVGLGVVTALLTTNLGQGQKSAGFMQKESGAIAGALKKTLRPELINRIDKTVVFSPLDQSAIRVIAQNMLEELRERLLAQQLDIEFDDSVCEYVVECNKSYEYGARNVRRLVSEKVANPIAKLIATGALEQSKHITLTLDDLQQKLKV